jgi:hypothetical protein
VAWLQDTWGAGVWYVTMVRVHGLVRAHVILSWIYSAPLEKKGDLAIS